MSRPATIVHVAGGIYLVGDTYTPLCSTTQEWLLEVLNDELFGAIAAGKDPRPIARRALDLIAARVDSRRFELSFQADQRKSQGGTR